MRAYEATEQSANDAAINPAFDATIGTAVFAAELTTEHSTFSAAIPSAHCTAIEPTNDRTIIAAYY